MVTFYLLSVVVLGPQHSQHSNHFHGQHDSSRCSPASRVVALFFTSLVPKEGTVKLYLLSAVVIGKAPAFESFNHFIASTNPFVALLFIFLVPKARRNGQMIFAHCYCHWNSSSIRIIFIASMNRVVAIYESQVVTLFYTSLVPKVVALFFLLFWRPKKERLHFLCSVLLLWENLQHSKHSNLIFIASQHGRVESLLCESSRCSIFYFSGAQRRNGQILFAQCCCYWNK